MAQVTSADVARPRKTPKKGSQAQVHIMLSAELIELIDRVAAQLDEALVSRGGHTRTDAIRTLLVEGLRQRGLAK